MQIYLFGFPENVAQSVNAALEERGHSTSFLNLDDLYIRPTQNSSGNLIIIYHAFAIEESLSTRQQIQSCFNRSIIWLVSPSFDPEDVRIALRNGYQNYIFWEPDMKDLLAAVDELDHADILFPHIDRQHSISYLLNQQIWADRLMSILISGAQLNNRYASAISQLPELKDRQYATCVIKPLFPTHLYFSPDYEKAIALLMDQIQSHITETLTKCSPSFNLLCFAHKTEIVCLIYAPKETDWQKEFLNFYARLSVRVQQYQNACLWCGYSPVYYHLNDTTLHYNNIHSVIKQGDFSKQAHVLLINEPHITSTYMKDVEEAAQKNLLFAIANNNFDFLVESVCDTIDRFKQENVSFSVAKNSILRIFLRYAQDSSLLTILDPLFVEQTLPQIIQRVPLFCDLKEIFTILQTICSQAMHLYYNEDQNRLSLAMNYIQQNYKQKITLQSVSNFLALSPNYFCGWFKKQTGESFSDALLHYRIEIAKQMLTSSDYKIHDIAEQVGYPEIVSFNRMFKKVVGLTPSEFRAKHSTSDPH